MHEALHAASEAVVLITIAAPVAEHQSEEPFISTYSSTLQRVLQTIDGQSGIRSFKLPTLPYEL